MRKMTIRITVALCALLIYGMNAQLQRQDAISLNVGFLAANDAQSFVFEEAFADIQQSIKIDSRLNITFQTRIGCFGGLSVFYASQLYHEAHINAIIGPGCSTGMGCIARLSSLWNIPQIAFSTIGADNTMVALSEEATEFLSHSKQQVSSDIITDGFRQPHLTGALFSTLVDLNPLNTDVFSGAFYAMIRNAKWTSVAIVYDKSNSGLSVYSQYLLDKNHNGVDIQGIEISEIEASEEKFTADASLKIRSIPSFTRLILLVMGKNYRAARNVLKFMRDEGINSNEFVIVLPLSNQYNNESIADQSMFSMEKNTSTSEVAEMEESNRGAYRDDNLFSGCLFLEDDQSISTITKRFYWNLIKQRTLTNITMKDIYDYSLIYDSLKLYILTVNTIVRTDNVVDLNNGTAVFDHMRNSAFEGASGTVRLNANARRVPSLLVLMVHTFNPRNLSESSFTRLATLFPRNVNDVECSNLSVLLNEYKKECTEMQFFPQHELWQRLVVRGGVPECGYDGGHCSTVRKNWFAIIGAATLIIALCGGGVLAFILWRRAHQKILINNSAWLLPVEEVHFLASANHNDNKKLESPEEKINSMSDLSDAPSIDLADADTFDARIERAVVYSNVVKLRRFKQLKTITFDIVETRLLNQVKQLVHDNVNPLVGLCCNNMTNELLVLWKYCLRGTLANYLHNSDRRMDANFKVAFLRDIISGLDYLHNTVFGYHGYLHSANCVIDANFIVKIVAVGVEDLLTEWRNTGIIDELDEKGEGGGGGDADHKEISNVNKEEGGTRNGGDVPLLRDGNLASQQHSHNRRSEDDFDWINGDDFSIFYRAPEQLRSAPPTRLKMLRMSKSEQIRHKNYNRAADVYALGMIFYEVLFRRRPFSEVNMSKSDLVNALRHGNTQTPLRPVFPQPTGAHHNHHPTILSLIRSCWHESPLNRPNMRRVRRVFGSVYKMNSGLVSSVISMMDQHSHNLEKQVRERTRLLEEAQIRADRLLSQMIPKDVARDLKLGKPVLPRSFSSASVLFTDIVSFTNICAQSTPMEIVSFLNDLFTGYDDVISQMDAFKVETIGDAYMVVSGVPKENGTEHANVIAQIALKMRKYLIGYKLPHILEHRMQARWGMHTGTVAAGVVGLTAPRYCLFGDTVNMASRMESSGEAGRIQISQELHDLLVLRGDTFETRYRGVINVKGKGECNTYWLCDDEDEALVAETDPLHDEPSAVNTDVHLTVTSASGGFQSAEDIS